MVNRNILTRALTASTAALVLAVATVPLAASATPHNRVAKQQELLQQGLASGQLTKAEYNRNEARLSAINAQRRADLKANGGSLTAAEHQQLRSELNNNSHGIFYSKHNSMNQPGARQIGKHELPGPPNRNAPGYVADRMQRQADRIHNGMVNGSLTRGQYLKDMSSLRSVEAQRTAWMKAQGGVLTDAQKAQLTKELDATGGQIRATRHDQKTQRF